MTVAQELLKDNQDNLEKKSRSLDPKTELPALEKVKNQADVVEAAKQTKLQIKMKDGSTIPVSARVLMEAIARGVSLAEGTNYKQKLQSADIKVKVGNNLYLVDTKELGRGSEVMAFLQVAAGGNLVPDGKFGQATADAFSKFIAINTGAQTKVEEKDKLQEKFIKKYKMENYIKDTSIYNVTVNELGKDVAELFKDRGIIGTDGFFVPTRVSAGEKSLQISKYTSPYRKGNQIMSIEYNTITAQDGSVDDWKLLTQIKQNIDKTDAQGKKEQAKEIADKNAKTLENSAKDAVDNIGISTLSNPLVRELVQKKYSFTGKSIDFDLSSGRTNGIVVENGIVNVNIPGSPVSYKLSTLENKDHTFNTPLFLKNLEKHMLPLAKAEKARTLSATYTNLLTPKANAINDIPTLDKKLVSFKALDKSLKDAIAQGVIVAPSLSAGINQNIDQLNKQKNYLVAKDWISSDVDTVEKTYKTDPTQALEKSLSRLKSFAKTDLLLTANNRIGVKSAFKSTGKEAEFNNYIKRYNTILNKSTPYVESFERFKKENNLQ